MNRNFNGLIKFAAATVLYSGFAIYLYYPYFMVSGSIRLEDLFIVNACLASLGCFLLSRRWVIGFAGSFLAGAVYGFGPFTLGLAGYHPTVAFLAAIVPWLFLPAAFAPGGKCRWLSWLLLPLPFLAIIFFFQITTHYYLFPIPIQTRLHLSDLVSLLVPLVMATKSGTLIGFYHIPVAGLMVGGFILLTARRFGIIAIFCIGLILAFCESFFDVSPIIWLTIPVLYCSVLVGVGTQAMASAGFADRKWILATAITMGLFTIITLLLARKYFSVFAGLGVGYAKILTETAKIYLLGTISIAAIFIIVRANFRLTILRWIILCSAMALDIFLSARMLIDKII